MVKNGASLIAGKIFIWHVGTVAEYEIYSKKSAALLYTKNKDTEREIRETSPFTIATNSIKYLGVTLTKEVKDLFDKNFKVLKKEIEIGKYVTLSP